MDHRSRISRIAQVLVALGVALALLIGPFADTAFAQPKEVPGKGAGGGLPVAITGNAPEAMSSAYNNIITELTRSGVVAFMNALQVFFGQLAYDAADYIASGGNGQSAVFYKKGFGQYLKDVASDSAGEFMGSLSDSSFFRGAGFNLCQPKNPLTLLKIQMSLGNFFPGNQGKFARPQPKCNFKDVIANWDSVAQTMSNDDVLSNIQSSFNTNSNDLGVAVSVFNQQLFKVSSDTKGSEKSRDEGGGFKAISDSISGNVKTPGAVVSEATKDEVVRGPKSDQAEVTGAILSNAFDVGPIQLAAYTTSVFLNTLGSKMMKRIFDKGLAAFDFSDLQAQSAALGSDAVVQQSKTDARKANIDLRTPRLQQVATFEIVSELQACPSTNRGLWNCAMDQAMSQAAQPQGTQGGMTVAEAMSRDYIHPSWTLIPDTKAKENRDSLCYTYAYCAGNLQKLRLARILPVGFEFAANSPENIRRCYSSSGCVTLKEVVAGFNNCNAQGGLDASHPWCHLIDPNWVVTSVPQQCALSGYGDNLMTQELGQRKQECQDVQTCLQRNDKGECTGGYGYCMSEKTVYRFDATECSATYASCRAYTNRGGQPVDYLRNTLDYGTCTANNVGCLWYATTRLPSSTSTDDVWVGTAATGPRMYFDNAMETCPASDDGCTKLYRAITGQPALNLVVNPSFENVATDTAHTLLGWSPATPQTTDAVTSGTTAVIGAVSQAFPSLAASVSQRVPIVGLRTYTVSVYGRLVDDAAPGFLNIEMVQYDSNGAIVSPGAQDYRSQGCTLGDHREPNIYSNQLSSGWQRYQCTFLSAASATAVNVTVKGSGVREDGVQLEESETATDFVDGINQDLEQIHLKLPPDDFACTGSSSTDSPQCNNYAKICRQVDAGCDGYTDVAGGPEIPGILSTNDTCPATCVGYEEYRKQPSAFDYIHDADPRFDDPADTASSYFIPQTAAQCTQADVGCEEFTNLDATGATAEQKNYFSYVRTCEKPDANTQTYFTWEGSDVTGFQLRTWSLKKADGASDAPRVIVKIAPDQVSYKEPASCNQTTWRAGLDPDCRQFYTAGGSVYYAYYSQTVLSTDACTTYRLNHANATDCQKTAGNYNVATGECTYQVYEPESRTCSEAAVGCRAYAGAGQGNQVTLLSADFRNSTSSFANGDLSNEALLVGDSSLRVPPSGSGSSAVFTTNVAVSSTPADLMRVTFWAKSPGATTNVLTLSTAPTQTGTRVPVGTVTLTPDWQQFTVGLFSGAPDSQNTYLFWSAAVRNPASFLFIDQVNVSRVRDVVYAREGTWQTPQECDQTAYGVPQPQAMLGCRAYTNRRGEVSDVRQFSRLCKQDLIGCTAFVDTRNSDSISAETFVKGDNPPIPGYGTATTVRPADRYVYAVDEPSKRCPVTSESCRAFGLPQYSQDRSRVDKFTTVYYKDDITKYDVGLCQPSALFCDAFTHGASTEYFKDPQNHTCQYREQVALAADATTGLPAGTYSGWFMTGQDVPCYPGSLSLGNTFDMVRTGDHGYAGYAASCTDQYGECTELRDPNDHSDPVHPTGKPYYFIMDDKLDTASCAGNVDTGNGCVLMRNMSDSSVRYNVAASYAKYSGGGFSPTSPVDCNTNPTDPSCLATKRCEGEKDVLTRTQIGIAPAVLSLVTSTWVGTDACTSDTQCNPTYAPVVSHNGSATVSVDTAYHGICVAAHTNDANLLLKVKMDRDCSQWLGCQSSETVFDSATGKYKDICTNLAMCDQTSGQAGDIFCSHYVPRDATTTEPILTTGAYFDMGRYVSRVIGLGQRDYSGYSIPNSFQVPDLVSTRVAADGLNNTMDTSRYAEDYRLAAAITIPRTPATGGGCAYPTPNETQARILCRDQSQIDVDHMCSSVSDVATRYMNLNLCQDAGNGRVGFYDVSDLQRDGCAPINCYLPVHGLDDTADFTNVSQKFSLDHPENDALLSSVFPPAECRAYPEADSPFPTSYVKNWDVSKNPPAATDKVEGYQNAKTCEFGEDCSCTYKRVSYPTSAVTKFYNVNSQNVPPGICQGGPRDGQSCIPETIAQIPQARQTQTVPASGSAPAATGVTQAAIEGSNVNQSCGPIEGGGHCVALGKIEIVRGYFGQCLEHDSTRTDGADSAHNPCLTWNPTPILFGDKDVYHFNPSAGYLPPQNAGQYYCISKVTKPSTIHLTAPYFVGHQLDLSFEALLNHTQGTPVPFAGSMTKLDYDDQFTSDGDCIGCTGNARGATLDGGQVLGSVTANNCEYTDDDQDDDNNATDANAVRLIGSGRSIATSYTETFLEVNSSVLAGTMFRVQTSDATKEEVYSAALDSNFGYISTVPITNPNGNGRLACAYQADWVDGMTGPGDYNDVDQEKAADVDWHNKFNANFNPTLTRGSERIFTTPDGTSPLAVPCVKTNDKDPDWNQCYLKFWQTDYRKQDTDNAFVGLYDENKTQAVKGLEDIRSSPLMTECHADKPYFSIRAVFQANADPADQNGLQASQLSKDTIQGPWRFVGFWVTTCAAKTNDYRYIYMYIDLTSADVCTDLAEVKSRNSNQDAAFTDRVWKDGHFLIPSIGFQYNSKFAPFDSALNTKPASHEPLFQTGEATVGFSPLTPPVFLSSGADTYYRTDPDPKDKWAYLSNIFARIYRVYHYYNQAVTSADKACTAGPFKGERCTVNVTLDSAHHVVPADPPYSNQCNPNGTCVGGALPAEEAKQNFFCNSLSGVNSGLACAGKTDVCHTGAVDPRQLSTASPNSATAQGATQLLLPCETQSDWYQLNGYWTKHSDATVSKTTQEAAAAGAFQCPHTWYSMRAGQACSTPTTGPSSECPMEVVGRCAKPGQPTDALGGGRAILPDGTPDHVTFAIPGHCEMLLPHLDGTRQPAYPKDASGYLTSGMPSGTAHVANPNNDPNFEWVNLQALNASSPSCFGDYDCSYTSENFYLSGKFPYTRSVAFDAGPTPNGPIYSVRSRMLQSQPSHPDKNDGGCDPSAAPADVTTSTSPCLATTAYVTGGNTYAHHDDTHSDSVDPYHNQLFDGVAAAFDRVLTAAGMGAGGNFIVNGLDATGHDSHIGGANPRNFWRDELDRWPGAGLMGSPTPEVMAQVANVLNSIPLLGDVLNLFGAAPQTTETYNLAACEPVSNYLPQMIGKCVGGIRDGSVCRLQLVPRSAGATVGMWQQDATGDLSCASDMSAADADAAARSCGPVATLNASTHLYIPVAGCMNPTGHGDPNSTDPDLDQNVCTHGIGYFPRIDLCPDPTDEFCGLISYNITHPASINPDSQWHLPTDVTSGLYSPSMLGFTGSASRFDYTSYYKPQPPRIAAPDTRNCATPGDCPIQKLDAMAFDGQSEGIINVAGGQHKSTIEFYGWAAHNQMPLRALSVDWGDGFVQNLPDARLKNHKPLCDVQKECSDPVKGLGLTCQTDSDCPTGAGSCQPMGTCSKNPAHVCRADGDCTSSTGVKDTCVTRTFFGNSGDACEANYFQFDHLYTCNGLASVGGRSCTENGVTTRCSRNPDKTCSTAADCAPGDSCVEGLAPPGGCWDASVNSCRFTPRVWMEDNWGWCTGECRQLAPTPTSLLDVPASLVRHYYGGCYSGSTQGAQNQNVRVNDVTIDASDPSTISSSKLLRVSECDQTMPKLTGTNANLRPWIVYSGALYLRSNGQ